MKRLLTVLVILLWAIPASATTYYVRTDGSDSNAGTTNSAGGAWLTIGKCASTIVAGDYCRVQPGTYSAVVTEATSGSAGNFITYIADGAVTVNGFVVQGSYVRIIGFTVEGADARNDGIYMDVAFDPDHVEVWNNTIQNFIQDSIGCDGGVLNGTCNNSIFIGNVSISPGSKDINMRGTDILVAYNESDATQQDFLYLFGQRIRVLNNYSHDINAASASHTDFLQTASDTVLGLGTILVEGNRYDDADSPSTVEHHHASNLQNNASGLDGNSLHRFNLWNYHGSYSWGYSGSNFNNLKFHNETIAYAQIFTGHTAVNSSIFSNASQTGQSWKNNIFHQAWGTAVTTADPYGNIPAANLTVNNNLYYDTGGSISYTAPTDTETGALLNTDPEFVDPSSSVRNFTLQSTSGAIGAGAALTLANGGGTGSTVTVDDAAWFRAPGGFTQYGDDLAPGDKITVGTDVCSITSISGNDITCAETFTWADNDPVYFGTDTTPDIGALPYRAGGYSLSATYSCNGSTCTITPNASDLVRFVVCYEAGVPYAVDNSSTYTCTDPSGAFEARVYPLYASTTLWAVATEAGAGAVPAVLQRLRLAEIPSYLFPVVAKPALVLGYYDSVRRSIR